MFQLLALQTTIQRGINDDLVGRTFDVLVTGWGREPNTRTGRTPCHRIVHFSHEAREELAEPGQITPVRIERALPHSLLGSRT